MYYGWSKEFLEAGKRRLAGDTARVLSRSTGRGSPAGLHRSFLLVHRSSLVQTVTKTSSFRTV
jgi:hypothetical protein